MTRVKICGVKDAATAIAAAEAGADFVGIMFADSRRRVTPEECHEVVTAIHERRKYAAPVTIPGPERGEVSNRSWYGAWHEAIEEVLFYRRPLLVGVFANQQAAHINDIADAAKLDIVQLSGGESDDFVRQIERPVLRAVHVGERTAADDVLEKAPPGIGHAILLDTASEDARGGTGERFDWAVAAEASRLVPIMLAGGLDPDSVGDAIRTASPWAVDVSSGVETDGAKDVEKIVAFVRAAKGARV
jgi:phosphoribosylanthranilate isomerase